MLRIRDPALRRIVIVWVALLVGVPIELLLMVAGAGLVAPLIALIMAAIVVAVPMELPSAPNAGRIFALAGVFWLVFMLFGLGTLDPLTRHDQPTHFHSEP